jgi:chitin disaccharide deacetylase
MWNCSIPPPRRPPPSKPATSLGNAGPPRRPFFPACYTDSVRRLIVNADDFGMTRGINRAIAEAATIGIVTSTTLMATARAVGDAVTLTSILDARVSIGCHVILLDGSPVLPPDMVPSLLQSKASGEDNEFRIKLNAFARAAMLNKIDPVEIEAEASAQMQCLQDSGINLSHFDCHKHAHMFPSVLRPLLRAARDQRVAAVRNPFGRLFPLPVGRILGNPKMWRRVAELGALRSFAGNFKREVENHGLRTPDGSLGVLHTGTLDLESFLLIVDTLPEGTWEFVCHPGYNDAELDHVRTRLRQSRETELAVLTSPEARSALDRRGIELISYREL